MIKQSCVFPQIVHGSPTSAVRHVGDLGNINTASNGMTVVDIIDPVITLKDMDTNNVINRSIVVHAGEDDLGLGGNSGSSSTGNAGARLTCGIITEYEACKLK